MSSEWHSLLLPKLLLISVLLLLVFGVKSAELNTTDQQAITTMPLRIAAASDLRYVLDKIATQFTQQYPQSKIDIVYGSSGKLSAQIAAGAPFSVFFSADEAYVTPLLQSGVAKIPVQLLGLGQLVLWSKQHDVRHLVLADLKQSDLRTATFQTNELRTATLQTNELRTATFQAHDLRTATFQTNELRTATFQTQFKRIAMAEPSHAPYGARSRELLQQLGIWQLLQPNIVTTENVAKAAQLAHSGAVDAGIFALAIALSDEYAVGYCQLLDHKLHQPLRQVMVLTSQGEARQDAQDFAAFMQSASVRQLLRSYGFLDSGFEEPDFDDEHSQPSALERCQKTGTNR